MTAHHRTTGNRDLRFGYYITDSGFAPRPV